MDRCVRISNQRYNNIIISGFPSETEEEFQDTVRLLDELSFDFVEGYMFQPRPNTEATEMKNQIPIKVARRRCHKLYMKSLLNETRKKKNALKMYRTTMGKKNIDIN